MKIASNKLRSKSFKEIYMNWIYEKYLRNQQLKELEHEYKTTRRRTACKLFMQFRLEPPVRSTDQIRSSSVSGFNQHPNSSQEM
jgi:hypothetical protein